MKLLILENPSTRNPQEITQSIFFDFNYRQVKNTTTKTHRERYLVSVHVFIVTVTPTLRAPLSGTFLQRKDVVNQCLEFVSQPYNSNTLRSSSDEKKTPSFLCKFSSQASLVWNNLPAHIRHRSSLLRFRTSLKIFRFTHQ